MAELFFHLPIPPSQNVCYRNVKINLRIKTREAEFFIRTAHALACAAMLRQGWKKSGEKLVCEMWFYWPDKRRHDVDNALKILQDSLQGYVFDDDSRLLPRIMSLDVDRENPRVELKFYPIGDAQEPRNLTSVEKMEAGEFLAQGAAYRTWVENTRAIKRQRKRLKQGAQII